MSTVIIEFSPTGGTEKVARIIADEWGRETTTIDLADSGNDFSASKINESDRVVIALPVYGGSVPQVALDRLAQIKGSGAACVLLCVYGNRAFEHALADMQVAAEACGFRVVAGIAGVAEHSIAHQYGAGRPDAADAERLRDFARQIAEKGAGLATMPGDASDRSGGASANLLVPKPGRGCTRCEACVRLCPVGAIDPASLKADPRRCIDCMRCVSVCPSNARKPSAMALAAVGAALKKACSQRREPELFL